MVKLVRPNPCGLIVEVQTVSSNRCGTSGVIRTFGPIGVVLAVKSKRSRPIGMVQSAWSNLCGPIGVVQHHSTRNLCCRIYIIVVSSMLSDSLTVLRNFFLV